MNDCVVDVCKGLELVGRQTLSLTKAFLQRRLSARALRRLSVTLRPRASSSKIRDRSSVCRSQTSLHTRAR